MAKLIACQSPATEIEGVPDKIKIMPLGNVTSQKGDFVVDAESFAAMKKTFEQRALDVVIDYEHQTLADVQAPAGGWIKELYLEDDCIAAKVEWTPKAAEYLKNKEYRYLSPVVLVRKSDQKAVVLHSVALTNTPAIDGMFPIINSIDINSFEGGENDMEEFLKKLAALLGLPETATEEEIMQVLQEALGKAKKEGSDNADVVANKTILSLLGVAENAKTEDVAAAIMALKNPTGFVPASEFAALKARLDKMDADSLVTKALKDGKISAAQKAWAEEYALKDPSGFQKFVEKAPQVVPVGELDIDNKSQPSAKQDETTMAVCKMLGVSSEDLEKYGKDV
ncbi:phage protease [Brevibacillus agri]|uniref:phage protease n=1 Tax=Brevibacillus agri TaxID=51101 RepID=UPI00287095C5|nr:phage protease [Brevibacillus agri]MDR9503402.1 phage protease [Brevibacillus agri]